MKGPVTIAAGVLLLNSLLTPSLAQTPASPNVKRPIAAVRLKSPPTIDGDLSDLCWKEAARADRFTDVLYGNPVPDQTVAYLGYDDKFIYVAFHCMDSHPEGIVARETKRGTRFRGEDQVAFSLDLFDNHQFADRTFFIINPLGTQFAHLGGGRATKLEWEGEWRAAAKIVPDGWNVEMAIPWSILNYPAVKGPTTCAVNFDRFQQRTNTHSWWSNIGPQEFNELDGRWQGVEYPRFRPQFSLLPYTFSGWQSKGGPGGRAGIDLRSALTPSMTLVGTVNPDFANVEQEVESIDFSYGERFVPDRRPFFQEGSGVYDIGGIVGSYFYSRRIPNFDAGENLYGKLNDRDTLGLLTALNPGTRSDWVLRGIHKFGPLANLGAALVNRDGTGPGNRVLMLGQDFRRGFWGITASEATSWVGGRQTGSAGETWLSYQSPRWFASVVPHFISPRFRDDLGFIPFTDYKGVSSQLNYSTQWRKGPLQAFFAGINTTDRDHYDGRLFRRERGAYAGTRTQKDYGVQLSWDGGRFEQFADSVFSVDLRARASDPFHTFGIGFSWGHQAGASKTFLTPSATWRFGERLTLGLASALLQHAGHQEQHILTFNYDFTPRQGIGGRIISQTGGTNGYLAFRRSGYGGIETFLILGDPNTTRFVRRLVGKVVWPM